MVGFFAALLASCLSRDWQFLNCQCQQGGKLTGDLFSDLQVVFKSLQREDSSQPLVQCDPWPSGSCPGLFESTGFQPWLTSLDFFTELALPTSAPRECLVSLPVPHAGQLDP